MKKILVTLLKEASAYIILCVAIFLMIRTTLQYTTFEDDVAFLQFKQEYLHIHVWKIAFYIHVFTSVFCLAIGTTQFSKSIRTDYPKVHRVMGKIYVYNILIINFPAALIMGVYANGLLISKTAFLILDVLWFWYRVLAVIEIKNKNIIGHQNYMIRSFALTLSAITLRTWKLVLSSFFIIEPSLLYQIDAWLGFVPNLIVAELLIYYTNKSPSKRHV